SHHHPYTIANLRPLPLTHPRHRPHTPPPFFFFNDTAPTEIYTLSLHDALPISDILNQIKQSLAFECPARRIRMRKTGADSDSQQDRKSTRLNSSHRTISYAVFCLKKKKKKKIIKT